MRNLQHPWQENRPRSPWLPSGFSRTNKRGALRTSKPIIDVRKCTNCGLCWIYCPEGVMHRGPQITIDYDYCTGCGVCAHECPLKAVLMVREE